MKKHYGFQRRWRRVRPHLYDAHAVRILERDLGRFVEGKFGKYGHKFKPSDLPTKHDNCDWRCSRRGRPAKWWDWSCHGACHWLVNFNRRLAELAEPRRSWLIVSSDEHSTVWDGRETLFDINMEAFGVSADEVWEMATAPGYCVLGKDIEYECGLAVT